MHEILVTGANGFVGSHLCEALLDAGYAVRALVRKTSNLKNISGLNLNLTIGDLTDPETLEKAVDGVDAIINNAGLTKALYPERFDIVNAVGTENLLRAMEKSNPRIGKFIQISSAAACGPSESRDPVNEDHNPRPLTAYGKSKLAGERAVLSYKDKFPVVILRPTAIYGPRDTEMLAFFKAIKFGIKPSFGRGDCYTNFTYVKDLAAAAVRALAADTVSGAIYFVAEKRWYSYVEAGDIIAAALGVRAINIYVPVWFMRLAGKLSENMARWRGKPAIFTDDKAVEISQKYWMLDTSKIEKEIGFISPTSLKDGVAETVEWYRRQKWL